MKLMGKFTATAAAAAFLAGAAMTPASAAPAVSPGTAGLTKATSDNVQLVRSWRHGGWRGHRHGGFCRGWGWGAAGLAAGLLLSSPYWSGYGYGPDYYYDEGYGPDYAYEGDGGFASCEATFKSFDQRSGTYMGYDGIRHRCPYL